MRVAINTLPAADRTGIGGFSRALLRALLCVNAGVKGDPFDLVALGGGVEEQQSSQCRSIALPQWSERFEQFHLGTLLRRHRVDLYHSPVLSAPIACDVPVAITIHDAIPCTHPHLTTPEFGRYWERWVRPAVRAAAGVLTVSHAAKGDLVSLLGIAEAKVHVVRQSIHPRMRPTTPEARRPILARHGLVEGEYILFVGGLDERKNITRLVEAFASLPSKRFALAIAGPTVSATLDLPALIRSLGVEQRVRTLGHVAADDLPALFGGAAVFAFPSLAEGFGRPVLEAMTCGTPVVASAIPALEELTAGAARLVPTEDVGALAAAIRELTENLELADQLRERGLRRAAEFRDETLAADCLAAYAASRAETPR